MADPVGTPVGGGGGGPIPVPNPAAPGATTATEPSTDSTMTNSGPVPKMASTKSPMPTITSSVMASSKPRPIALPYPRWVAMA